MYPPAHLEELWQGLRPVLDEELQRLPAPYRVAVVLCYLGGRTASAAALLLGCPTRVARERLGRGRRLLRVRLARRGVVLGGEALTRLLARRGGADVPRGLVRATIRAGLLASHPAKPQAKSGAAINSHSATAW